MYMLLPHRFIFYHRRHRHLSIIIISEWTEGSRNKVQPDQVEQDIGNYERLLFKLERQFANAPQPRKMANRLRVQVAEFKEKMPLIQTLFNPGLRDRHWDQISLIIGQPFKPDDDMTLNKVIEMDLMQYVPRLEQISEAASKEFSLEKAMEKMKKDWQNVSYRLDLIGSYQIETSCNNRCICRLICMKKECIHSRCSIDVVHFNVLTVYERNITNDRTTRMICVIERYAM
jgi:hypothetical protein